MLEEENTNSSTLTENSNNNSLDSDKNTSGRQKKPQKWNAALKPIAQECLCSLSWKDLSYWIPLSAERKEQVSNCISAAQIAESISTGDEVERGIPLPTVTKKGHYNEPQVQILFPSSGEIKPTEMVAILGPSGSGKTTMLDLLSQRAKLASAKCTMSGEVSINGVVLDRQHYSKVGAYVQQEDGLMEVLTAREVFQFACQIRLGLSQKQTEERVQSVIERFNLQECADQMIGGWLKRGISGGERKRVSIGYEMITDPSVLLLDEPTSGLDAHSAKLVVQQLRSEVERGLAIAATIHSPSADLLWMFDRVIVLSEGRTIYHGTPDEIRSYFQRPTFGFTMSLYSNPADKLLTLAAVPRRCIKQDSLAYKKNQVALLKLESECKESLRKRNLLQAEQTENLKNRLNVNTMKDATEIGLLMQTRLLVSRFVTQTSRLPLALIAVIIQGIIQGFLQAAMFSEVVNQEFSWRDKNQNIKATMNMLGLAFQAASDQFIMMSMAQLLQIPIARPIFQREVGNRMYTPTAYFLAHVSAGLVIFCFYPVFTALISYWFFGFAPATWSGMLDWMFCLALPSVTGSLWGFSFGSFFQSEMTAFQVNLIFILMFNLGAGHTTNLGSGATLFARFIASVSPVRYGTEMLMYRVLKGSVAEQYLLNRLGYTNGDAKCILALAIFAAFCLAMGWINLVRSNRAE